MIALELPWPPSVNHYWRFGKGNFYISPEGRRYKAAVAGILATAGIQPLRGAVKLTIDAFPPDHRRRDLDNLEKCLLDSLILRREFAAGFYLDDAQIKRKESTMWEFDPARPGVVIVTCSPWSGLSPARVPNPAPVPSLGMAVMEGGPP